jgi:hypothetical protein
MKKPNWPARMDATMPLFTAAKILSSGSGRSPVGRVSPSSTTRWGKDTFQGSLECLQPFGLLAGFGNSSGPVPPFDLQELSRRGSLYVTRATLFTHLAKRETMLAMADELFEVVRSGKVRIEVRQTYALREAARAHADLEARRTTGFHGIAAIIRLGRNREVSA